MKRLITLLLILVITGLNVRIYLHAGVPYTHDGENHLARFANYKIALREGQVPPRFAPNLMNHYGYPVFNYNYPLANIVSVPLSFAKVPYNLNFKVLVTAAVLLGCAGIWAVARQWRIGYPAVWLALAVYGLAPYLTTAIFFRGNIGEILAYSLIPWLVWAVERLRFAAPKRVILIAIGVMTAFLLSHNVTVLFVSPVLVLYAAVRYGKDWSAWKRLVATAGTAVLLSLWFWLPALAEKSLIVLDQANLSVGYADHFVTLSQLLFSPQTFGFSYLGSVDSLSFNLGLAAIFIWVIGWLLLLKLKLHKVKLPRVIYIVAIFWLVVATVAVILQVRQFSWVWSVLPMVRFIQLPWRLALLWSISVPLVALWLYRYWPRWVTVTAWILLAVTAIGVLKLQPVDYRYLNNQDLEAFSQSTTTLNENLPKNFTYLEIGDWQPTARVLTGEGQVTIAYWKGSDRQYQLELTQPSIIVEPTMLFAGWQTKITPENGDSAKVGYYSNDQTQGRLAYQLQPGKYQVRSQFTQWTWARVVGNTISALTLLVVIVWLLKGIHVPKPSR